MKKDERFTKSRRRRVGSTEKERKRRSTRKSSRSGTMGTAAMERERERDEDNRLNSMYISSSRGFSNLPSCLKQCRQAEKQR